MRYKILLDYLVRGREDDWERKLGLLYKNQFYDAMNSPEVPEYCYLLMQVYQMLAEQRVMWLLFRLFEMMSRQYGIKKAMQLSEIMNHRAPLTLRVNPLKISRDSFLRKWKDRGLVPTEFSPLGVKIV